MGNAVEVPANVGLDALKAHAVDAGATLVGPHKIIGMTEDIRPIEPLTASSCSSCADKTDWTCSGFETDVPPDDASD
jgi:hypothetical protein